MRLTTILRSQSPAEKKPNPNPKRRTSGKENDCQFVLVCRTTLVPDEAEDCIHTFSKMARWLLFPKTGSNKSILKLLSKNQISRMRVQDYFSLIPV